MHRLFLGHIRLAARLRGRGGSRERHVTQTPDRGIPLRAAVGIAYRAEPRVSNAVLFIIVE